MNEVIPAWWVRSCGRCGRHPLNYVNCDEWQCPFLGVRVKIEGPDDDEGIFGEESVLGDILDMVNSDPDAEDADPEDDTIGHPGDEMADWPLEEGEEEDGEDC